MTDYPWLLKPIQRTSLIDEVTEQLRNLILDGILKPGDKFPSENELCAQLRVSRTAIREAKKSLIGMGLLESRRGKGTFVRDGIFDAFVESVSFGIKMERGSVKELIEARRIIEVASAGLAAERATNEVKDTLLDLIDQMQVAIDTGDKIAFQKSDLTLHTTIAGATQNRIITMMVSTIRNLLEAFIETVLTIPGSDIKAQIDHKRVTEAILRGDVEEAKMAMNKHLDEVQRLIEEQFAETDNKS